MPPEPSDASPKEISVTVEHDGLRLDRYVAVAIPDLSRAFVQRLIEDGAVMINGHTAKPSARVRTGDRVAVAIPPAAPTELVATPMALTVIYEDDDLLVIDKPAGLVVHPAPGHAADTLVNALLARYPDLRIGEELRPGIVHRLDKDTSGLMVVAKNDRAMASLMRQMKDREVLKEYLTIVEGHLPAQHGVIDAAIGRHPQQRKRMAVVASGREARTHFVVLETIGQHTLLRIRLETGRTHQIRVHLASIGHPVECDPVYGRRACHCPELERQFLHAARLGFRLPSSGQYVEFQSELPPDLALCLEELRHGARG